MGYKLRASIPNVKYDDNYLELGNQYNERWDDFNDIYFGEGADGGWPPPETFDEFIRDLKKVNHEIIENKEEYPLHNIERLEKMFEFAYENGYYVYFESY